MPPRPDAPTCRVCGRRLTDAVSRRRGIGPVCRRKREIDRRQQPGLFEAEQERVDQESSNPHA